MQWVTDTLGGLWEMWLLLWHCRFRINGPYLHWRYETAFGSDPARRPPLLSRLRAILHFARWSHRMKRRRLSP